MTADTEDVEHILFAHEAAVGSHLGILAYGLDVLCIGGGWPHLPRFWAVSMDFETLADLPFLLEPRGLVPDNSSQNGPRYHS